MKSISIEIKQRRKFLNLTQEELAEIISVSTKTISNWENGKTTPDFESLIRLKQVLEISLDELLLEGTELMKNTKLRNIKYFRLFSLLSYLSVTSNLLILTQNIIHNTIIEISLYSAILSSFISLVYFIKKVNKSYVYLSEEEKKEDKKYNFFFIIGIILISLLIIVGLIYLKI